jgi:hypothetical protein
MADPDPTTKIHNVPFFVDGEKHEAPHGEMTVAAVLELVGKTITEWYLVLRHGREQTEYRDDERVPIKPGSKFLTVSIGPTPVS